MKPNFTLPLASSYNTRGLLAYANAQAGKDQRKLNLVYEQTQNAITGKQELVLAIRPGVTKSDIVYGVNTQTPYLISIKPGALNYSDSWIALKDGTASKVSDGVTTTTVLSSAAHVPGFIDLTNISGTTTAVIQLVDQTTATLQAQRVYYSSAIATFNEITDTDFTSLKHMGKMEHIDGYALVLSSLNNIHASALNSLTDWQSGSYTPKSITQDIPVGLAKLKGIILAFGAGTVECYENSGNEVAPLKRIPQLSARIGMVAHTTRADADQAQFPYYCTIGSRIYFVGRQAGAFQDKSLYSFDGSQFEVIPRMNRILGSIPSIYGIHTVDDAKGRPAVAILTTAPGAVRAKWLMFYPEWNEWFEWESDVFSPINNGTHFVGSGLTGTSVTDRKYSFSNVDKWADDTTNYGFITVFELPDETDDYKSMLGCGVVADTMAAGQVLKVAFSDNDYGSFGTIRDIDMSKAEKKMLKCGSYKRRAVRLSYDGAANVRLKRYYAEIK